MLMFITRDWHLGGFPDVVITNDRLFKKAECTCDQQFSEDVKCRPVNLTAGHRPPLH